MATGKKPKILLVFCEALGPTVIDSQVLLHARAVGDSGAAEVEVWRLSCQPGDHARSKPRLVRAERLSGCRVRSFRGVFSALPCALWANALILAFHILRLRPGFDVIHARGDFTAGVCARLTRLVPARLVWDQRGDAEAEFREAFRPRTFLGRLAKAYKLRGIRLRNLLAARRCDRAVFVSRALRDQAAPALGSKPAFVIPCAAPEKLFYFDRELRRQARDAFGYGDGNTVYVYAGGMAAYQLFPETVAAFRDVLARDPASRLLVVTPDPKTARPFLAGLPPESLRLVSAEIEEVNACLNAADAAFLLRAPGPINAAASPTKFAEYCLAGLPVIMTRATPDSFALAREFGNLCEFADGRVAPLPSLDRREIMERARKSLSRGAVLAAYLQAYGRGGRP